MNPEMTIHGLLRHHRRDTSAEEVFLCRCLGASVACLSTLTIAVVKNETRHRGELSLGLKLALVLP